MPNDATVPECKTTRLKSAISSTKETILIIIYFLAYEEIYVYVYEELAGREPGVRLATRWGQRHLAEETSKQHCRMFGCTGRDPLADQDNRETESKMSGMGSIKRIDANEKSRRALGSITVGMAVGAWLSGGTAFAAGHAFQTATPGVLAIATEVGNPGWMNGTDPSHIEGGVEWEMAMAFAKEQGIAKVDIRNAPFTPLISGSISGYDLGLMTIFKTPAREKVNHYSNCYYTEYTAALVKKGTVVKTLEDAKKLQWGHVTGGYAGLLVAKMAPSQQPKNFQDGATEYNALLSHSVDGILDDLSSVAGRAHSKGYEGTEVGAVFKIADQPIPCAAVQLPASAPKSNVDAVNAFLDEIQSDGRLEAWKQKYLAPNGVDFAKYPMIEVK